jgi:hypothetical protein
LGLRPEHRQHGAANGRGLFGTDRPLGQGRKPETEEGVGVLDRLRHGSGQTLVEERPHIVQSQPPTTLMNRAIARS